MGELCGVFDALPVRPARRVERGRRRGSTGLSEGMGDAEEVEGGSCAQRDQPAVVTHQDAKRVLLAMKAHVGMGGDGTVVYYIVQEGEVKPRQN